MTLELFRVTVTYRDLQAHKEWNRRCQIASESSRPFEEPLPKNCEREVHAAVSGAFGHHMVAEAGRLAINDVVGPPESWEKFQAIVTRVEYIGSCSVGSLAETEEKS